MNATRTSIVSALLALVLAGPVLAENHYVRAGATGDGRDWSNALGQLPAKLVRGDAYYLAGGSYPAYGFAPPAGTPWIVVKKATEADHGASTGWQGSYGAAQAVFPNLAFRSADASYLEVNGQTPDGIKIQYETNVHGATAIAVDYGVSHLVFKYLDLAGPGNSDGYSCAGDDTGLKLSAHGATISDVTISHVRDHGTANAFKVIHANNVTIEYSTIYDIHVMENSSFRAHCNVINAVGAGNLRFRYNDVSNWDCEGVMLENGVCPNCYIYGNVWHDRFPGGTSRVAEAQHGVQGPLYLYNNTFVNLNLVVNFGMGGSWAPGSDFKNNLIYNVKAPYKSPPENHDLVVTDPAAVFVNAAAHDYHLKAGSPAIGYGVSVTGSEYAFDRDGAARPSGAKWDAGAYQYKSPGTKPPAAPEKTPASDKPAGSDGK